MVKAAAHAPPGIRTTATPPSTPPVGQTRAAANVSPHANAALFHAGSGYQGVGVGAPTSCRSMINEDDEYRNVSLFGDDGCVEGCLRCKELVRWL